METQTQSMGSENESFNIEDLPTFLITVLEEVELICREETIDLSKVEAHLVVVDKSLGLLRELSLQLPGVATGSDTNDLEHFKSLSDVFADILSAMQQLVSTLSVTPATVAENFCLVDVRNPAQVGRPKFHITSEVLEDLRNLGFSWTKIAMMMGVSRWTISRRVKDYGLENMRGFSPLPPAELDNLVRNYMDNHGTTSGQTYVIGYIKSLRYRVQRSRVRECLARLDPRNTALRWGVTVSRRVYSVPWPNSLWHLDGHHSLIRWKLVIHGCIDGFSRRIMFLKCSSNNLAETVLVLFEDAIENDGGLWPSRIRVDRGVENVLVCEAMVMARGEGRGSFIPGPSTHNQRIERLWRDVYRCVCHMYYYVFYGMEMSGVLNPNNTMHLFVLHLVYLPRINHALHEYKEAFNHHAVRTENNWSPYQMWLNGMMHERNPLAHAHLDDDPDDLECYGYDAQGPSPLEDNGGVVVSEVILDNNEEILSFVLENLDPLSPSNDMGVDIFVNALQLVKNRIRELNGPTI